MSVHPKPCNAVFNHATTILALSIPFINPTSGTHYINPNKKAYVAFDIINNQIIISNDHVTWEPAGGLSILHRTNVTNSTYNILSFDTILGVVCTEPTELTLPSSNVVAIGKIYYIKDEGDNASTNNITISTTGEDVIEGITNKIINSNYGSLKIYNAGNGNWFCF